MLKSTDLAAGLPSEHLHRLASAPIWQGAGLPVIHGDGGGVAAVCAQILSAWQTLAPDSRSLLELIVRKWGSEAFTEEQLVDAALSKGLSGLEARLETRRLIRSGVLYAVKRTFGDSLFFLPSDLFPIWLNAALQPAFTPLSEADARRVLTEGAYKPPFAVQLTAMLAELLKQGTAFTAKGVLSRKAAERAAARLALDGGDLAGLAISTSRPDSYPKPLAIGLDALLALGVLRERPAGLAIVPDALRRWLAQPARLRESGLNRLLSERLSTACRQVMHASAFLAGLPSSVWYRVAELTNALPPETEAAAVGWLRALCGLGWLQLGEAPDGDLVFRWLHAPWEERTDGDAEREPIRILPNGEIMVFPETDLSIRWGLEAIAEPVSDDRIAVYRLTAGSIAEAAKRGRTPESVLDLLEAGSGDRPPDGVQAAVTGWFRQARNPSPKVPSPIAEISPLDDCNLSAAYVNGCDPLRGCSLDPAAADIADELLVPIAALPAAWTASVRTYHHSTRRQMLEQAIRLGLPVVLDTGGEASAYVPERLIGGAENWLVELRAGGTGEKLALSPDKWSGMMLRLPAAPRK